MSNVHKLFDNGIVDFWIYESGENNYSINMSVDSDHADTRVHIAGLPSKKVIEMAVDMILAVMPHDEEKQQKILPDVVQLQKAIASWE